MLQRTWRNLLVKLLIDLLVIDLSFLLALFINFGLFDVRQFVFIYYQQILFINILWLVIFNLAGLYKTQKDVSYGAENFASVSFGVFSAAFFNYIIIMYVYPEASYSKGIITAGSVFVLFLMNISRFFIAKRFNG